MTDPVDELAPRRLAKRNRKLAAMLEAYLNGVAEKHGFEWRAKVTAEDAGRLADSIRVVPPTPERT